MMSSKKKLGELIYTLEDHIYDEASDAFEKLYDETDPGKMVEEVLDIVHICKWDADYDDMIRIISDWPNQNIIVRLFSKTVTSPSPRSTRK